MSVEVFVDVKGVDWRLRNLEKLFTLGRMGRFLESDVTLYLQQTVKNRFVDEGDSASGKWVPLKGRTQMIRGFQGYGTRGPINIRTGKLRSWAATSASKVYESSVGITMRYPRTSPGKNTPLGQKIRGAQGMIPGQAARPVIAADSGNLETILKMLQGYVETRL